MVRQLLRGRELGQEASKPKDTGQKRTRENREGGGRTAARSRSQTQKAAGLASDSMSEAGRPGVRTGDHDPTAGSYFSAPAHHRPAGLWARNSQSTFSDQKPGLLPKTSQFLNIGNYVLKKI